MLIATNGSGAHRRTASRRDRPADRAKQATGTGGRNYRSVTKRGFRALVASFPQGVWGELAAPAVPTRRRLSAHLLESAKIVGSYFRLVERVTGWMTRGRVALAGA